MHLTKKNNTNKNDNDNNVPQHHLLLHQFLLNLLLIVNSWQCLTDSQLPASSLFFFEEVKRDDAPLKDGQGEEVDGDEEEDDEKQELEGLPGEVDHQLVLRRRWIRM